MLHHPHKKLQHRVGSGLEVDVSKVSVDGVNGDVEVACNGLATFCLSNHTDDLFFSIGEHGISFHYNF